MQAFANAYATPRGAANALIAIACAHHRMTWIHPFPDGNGRAARLQTHVAMLPMTHGLWSINRGLARDTQNHYYHYLSVADSPRQGDLDGRGNLSEQGLCQWLDYFLRICEDQVQYMSGMLALDAMKNKIAALVHYHASHKQALRPEAIIPLHYLFMAGSATRGEFSQMTGLGIRTARTLLSDLLKLGLVVSDTSHAPVRLGLPVHSLQFLFPNLYGVGEL